MTAIGRQENFTGRKCQPQSGPSPEPSEAMQIQQSRVEQGELEFTPVARSGRSRGTGHDASAQVGARRDAMGGDLLTAGSQRARAFGGV